MKLVAPISIYCLSFAWLGIAWTTSSQPATRATLTISIADSASTRYANLYYELNLDQAGLSKKAFDYAVKGYNKLLAKKVLTKDDYLTICDMSRSSSKKRLFLIDMADRKLVLKTYVAHGRNSGEEYATRFSNRNSSLQSSLGFYVTRETYHGEHGLSLRVNGLEKGYNDNARSRAIVIHGADYIEENWLQATGRMGRSYGCPAIPRNESKKIIDLIKNGSCMFIYHPSMKYIKGSKILNG